MALIKCPECGNNVSDKSEICIHCGYPIKNMLNDHENNNNENRICSINDKSYDLYHVLELIRNRDNDAANKSLKKNIPDLSFRERTDLMCIMRVTNKVPIEFSYQIGREMVSQIFDQMVKEDKREKLRQKGIDPDAPAACPSCGSTQFSTLQRGHSLIFGWLGSGEPQNVCQKCGYKWTPGRR